MTMDNNNIMMRHFDRLTEPMNAFGKAKSLILAQFIYVAAVKLNKRNSVEFNLLRGFNEFGARVIEITNHDEGHNPGFGRVAGRITIKCTGRWLYVELQRGCADMRNAGWFPVAGYGIAPDMLDREIYMHDLFYNQIWSVLNHGGGENYFRITA